MLVAALEAPPYLGGLVALVAGAALVAYFGFSVRLVPIVGFLLTGVVIGPNALGLVDDAEVVRAAADVGVLLLLFTIGIEFSLERLKDVRRALFIGGGLQVALTTAAVTAVLAAVGVEAGAALFTGLLVSLSSTAIVFKLLSDRGTAGREHGRIAVAVLLFQDLAIVAMVLVVPVLGGESGAGGDIAVALLKAAGVVAAALVLARRVLPPVLERVARTCSPEIFLLSVIAVCLGTAYASALAGLSVSLGAFLAGLIVSESRFQSQALGEVLPLQIVFSAVFFVSVGMLVDLGFLVDHLPAVLGVIAAVLVVKVLTTGVAVLALGRPVAVAAATGLLLAQVGEFSFVLAQVGESSGLTPAGQGEDGTQAFIAATVLLMAATPWLSGLGERLGRRLEAPAATDRPLPDPAATPEVRDHVLVAGYGQWARGLTRVLQESDVPQMVVTLSPHGAADAHEAGIPVLLGDPGRTIALQEAGIDAARFVVVLDDEPERARHVVSLARALAPEVEIVVRTRYAADVPALQAAGASRVVTEEVEASVILAQRFLHVYGIAAQDEAVRVRALRRLQEAGADTDSGALVSSPQRAPVDTESLIRVDLPSGCAHVVEIRPVVPSAHGCEECLRLGDAWVHLRVCLTCGHVGCCDSSPNRHARTHASGTGHHVIRSAEPGESWVYCLADELELAAAT